MQLKNFKKIQEQRKVIWDIYNLNLRNWAKSNNVKLPSVPDYATNNEHMFYLICELIEQRTKLLNN